MGLRYAEFVGPLVKAVQELSKMNDEKDTKINDLQNQINELRALMLSNTRTAISSLESSQTTTVGSLATLGQNIPNPFNSSTTINYYLPVNKGNASINLYSESGAIIKSVKLSGIGSSSINIKTAEFSSGTYRYALVLDGKIIDSKQMIKVK
ncbi:MAG: hypothetical protein ABI921_06685 [Panacibacter sp.]